MDLWQNKNDATSIRCKAWRGYKSGAYAQQELRDIEQSWYATVGRYLAEFTPERATFKTYVDMIVSRSLAKMVEARKTAFRTPPGGPAISLTTMVDDPDGGPPMELSSAFSLKDRDRAIGREPRYEGAIFEEVEAFRSVFDQLPETQQKLCKQVMEHGRIATHKQSGMTRLRFRLPHPSTSAKPVAFRKLNSQNSCPLSRIVPKSQDSDHQA